MLLPNFWRQLYDINSPNARRVEERSGGKEEILEETGLGMRRAENKSMKVETKEGGKRRDENSG